MFKSILPFKKRNSFLKNRLRLRRRLRLREWRLLRGEWFKWLSLRAEKINFLAKQSPFRERNRLRNRNRFCKLNNICYVALFLCLFAVPLTALEKYWKPCHWMWGYGFAFESDTCPGEIPPELDIERYRHVKCGDVVWIHQGWLYLFQKDILPLIHEPFILVINMSDETFPTFFRDSFDTWAFIYDPRIHHIFVQNCDLVHPKITKIPIGLDFHTIACKKGISPKRQEDQLSQILSDLRPTYRRLTRIFVDFQHHDTLKTSYNDLNEICGETRGEIFDKLCRTRLVDYKTKRIPRNQLWRLKGKYAFTVSPPGNGWDAHRTWEDLVLGCIVIVKSSPLDCLYEGLPVVIVKDWCEITKKNLQKWQKQYGDAFTNPGYRWKLTHQYWMNKIREKQKELGCGV